MPSSRTRTRSSAPPEPSTASPSSRATTSSVGPALAGEQLHVVRRDVTGRGREPPHRPDRRSRRVHDRPPRATTRRAPRPAPPRRGRCVERAAPAPGVGPSTRTKDPARRARRDDPRHLGVRVRAARRRARAAACSRRQLGDRMTPRGMRPGVASSHTTRPARQIERERVVPLLRNGRQRPVAVAVGAPTTLDAELAGVASCCGRT